MSSKQIVLTAGTELFGDRDLTAVDRHWAPDYRQHSALAPDGREGLRGMFQQLPPDFRFEPLRMLEDGDMVAVHCVYHGFGPDPVVAVDVFRVQDGRIAEHWDALAPLPGGAAGRHRIDGPTEITGYEHTAVNKALLTEWVHERLIGADRDSLEELARDPRYVEHGPGPDARLARHTLHRVLGEGDLVLTVTEALLELGGEGAGDPVPAGCYDLWWVADGRILEHWGVVQPVPERMPHGNGFF
ncbi:nuclear transport factor 2 family protein [Kocuria sp. CPCC 205263]|uniref:nuclear transport factor 2 family protein n=1 Tax=Kocuria sp. CPCC 205263 TaxID=3073555 RepID=UPI0034D5A55F